MAFTNLGWFYLAADEAVRIWVTLGVDGGAQWIMADPVDEGHPASLTVSDFTKERAYAIGNTDGEYFEPFTRYWVTVRNTSICNFPVHFTVQGGGNV